MAFYLQIADLERFPTELIFDMRLTQIKLSGFKSFVDPVSIPVEANLVGIVGPNGCGKSNIIDAVRWVMGESSAKHLRGGTMADVIFDGSLARKPVGMASVELVFDNSSQAIGGEYAAYDTILVRRQVSRDGQSVYSLNGSKCRRKDITDIFLGTGLGSRSYAIIEQGTISRLIEAKPDDLRTLIEEAAGISKYNDRRRETELRIHHTRENLDRLTDLRNEVATQIKHLKRQANKAEKFKQLKARERICKQELLAIRWLAFSEQISEHEQLAQSYQSQFANLHEEQQRLEQDLSNAQNAQNASQQILNTTQGEFYAAGADIARVEQSIKLSQQIRQDAEAELQRLKKSTQTAVSELDQDKIQLQQFHNEIDTININLIKARQLETLATRNRVIADRIRSDKRSALDSVRIELVAEKKKIEVENNRIAQYKEQSNQYQFRLDRLQNEKSELEKHSLSIEISNMQDTIETLTGNIDENQKYLQEIKSKSDLQRRNIKHLNECLHEERSQQQNCQGKITSLKMLQQHAMGKDNNIVVEWLEKRTLSNVTRLAEHLEVSPAWVHAVEIVLGVYLEAICIERDDDILQHLNELENETLAIMYPGGQMNIQAEKNKGIRLSDQVKSGWNVQGLLNGIYCAENLEDALIICKRLENHESVITIDGLWMGADWLSLNRTSDEKMGVLSREKELLYLKKQNNKHLSKIASVTGQLEQYEKSQEETDHSYEQHRSREQTLLSELSEIKSLLSIKVARRDHINQRLQQLHEELKEIIDNEQKVKAFTANATANQQSAIVAVTELEPQSRTLADINFRLAKKIDEIILCASDCRDQTRSLQSRLENLRSSELFTKKQLQRLESQQDGDILRSNALHKKLADSSEPLQNYLREREKLLEQRTKLEQQLKIERSNLVKIEQLTKGLAEKRVDLERKLEVARDKLEKIRIEGQTSKVRAQSLIEQLTETGVQVTAVIESLPDDADESGWSESLEDLSSKIDRLGSINLAAIEEHEEQTQRLEYLNDQHDDLIQSLETLEKAIAKIDQETKSRFKTTFEQINAGLQVKFPKLFGGGHATLELSEQNLLQAGVNVIAQPPGKKNSSIHLLSGGEKALTAVALVFSIFELNPAPFCLLDEVDAPLDDANVGRFTQLIKEMSETVQFIFITHNKVTMEVAKHLTGVTMNEPGVSRLVSVDIDEAMNMAVG